MNSWFHLFKKEFRLGLQALLIPIITFLIFTGIAGYIGGRAGFSWEAVVGVSIFATGLQVFYLIYYLFNSLQIERKKLHLWIHTPMPGYGLLSAKVAAGFVSMLITFSITATTLILAVSQSQSISEQLHGWQLTDLGLGSGIHLFLFALSFAFVFLFYWVVFLVFSRNLGSFISFLSTLVFFLITASVYSWFKTTMLYDTLTRWGEIHFSGITESINISTSMESGTEVITEVGSFSVFAGTYLFETAVMLLLFFAASWLLDRKVEV